MSAPLDPAYLASMSLKDLLEAHCGPGRLDQITHHGQRQILPLTVPSSGLEAREDPSLSGRQRLGLLDPPERDEQGAMDDTRGFPRATDERMTGWTSVDRRVAGIRQIRTGNRPERFISHFDEW